MSLRRQTFDNFDVVAVDDGSTDDTGKILAAWAAGDARVTVLTRHADGRGEPGLVNALNLAAGTARAPLLARMDADDIAHPQRFAIQLAHLAEHPDLAGCGTHVELFADPAAIRATAQAAQSAAVPADPDTPIGTGYRRYERWINAIETPADVERAAFVECPIAHPTLVLERSVFDAVGGYRDMGWPEDYDLILRVLAAGARLANVPRDAAPDPLLRWRVWPERHSLTHAAYSPAAFRCCRVHFLRHAFLPGGRPVVVWGAGKVGKPLARELIRQGTDVAAFVDLDPRKIGQRIHEAPVLSPREFAEFQPDGARPYVLAAVGSPGVRGEIRGALEALEYAELADFRFCA